MDNPSIIETVQEFLDSGWDGQVERGSERRKLFYRPATIVPESGEEYTAFTRDVSLHSLQLFHHKPVPMGPAQIEIQIDTDRSIRVAADIVWCGKSGTHYVSSARLREELQT